MRPLRTSAVVAAVAMLLLSACDEAPQGGAKLSKGIDRPPWDAAQSGFTAAGFQRGDRAAWEQQLRTRTQNQDEYTRTR